jgi:uncharacterized membrane protein YhaH (DUF805 family)
MTTYPNGGLPNGYHLPQANGSGPLRQPLYGSTIGQALSRFFKNYANFYGRASRSEYWWVFLVFTVISIATYWLILLLLSSAANDEASAVASLMFLGLLVTGSILFGLAAFIPSLAIQVRRLHDGNFSGWLILLHFIPPIGSFALFILMLMPPRPEGARYDLGAHVVGPDIYEHGYGTNGYDQPIYVPTTQAQPQFPPYPGQLAEATANPRADSESERPPSSSNPYLHGKEDGSGRKLRGPDES